MNPVDQGRRASVAEVLFADASLGPAGAVDPCHAPCAGATRARVRWKFNRWLGRNIAAASRVHGVSGVRKGGLVRSHGARLASTFCLHCARLFGPCGSWSAASCAPRRLSPGLWSPDHVGAAKHPVEHCARMLLVDRERVSFAMRSLSVLMCAGCCAFCSILVCGVLLRI